MKCRVWRGDGKGASRTAGRFVQLIAKPEQADSQPLVDVWEEEQSTSVAIDSTWMTNDARFNQENVGGLTPAVLAHTTSKLVIFGLEV